MRSWDDEKRRCGSPRSCWADIELQRLVADALRGGGNYSGDTAYIVSNTHDQRIASHASNAAIWSGIRGQVLATVYNMVVEI